LKLQDKKITSLSSEKKSYLEELQGVNDTIDLKMKQNAKLIAQNDVCFNFINHRQATQRKI
jgi:hypothetical protein